MRNGLLAWLVLALVPSAHAKTGSRSSVRSLKCTFPASAIAEWSDGELKTSLREDQDFSFHIDSIETKKQTAWFIGNAWSEDVAVKSRGRW